MFKHHPYYTVFPWQIASSNASPALSLTRCLYTLPDTTASAQTAAPNDRFVFPFLPFLPDISLRWPALCTPLQLMVSPLENTAPIFKRSGKEEGIESSPADRVLGGLLDEMLTMRENGCLGAQNTNCTLGCIKSSIAREGGISGLLFLSGETPALRSPSQEGNRCVEAGSEESPRDDQKASFL